MNVVAASIGVRIASQDAVLTRQSSILVVDDNEGSRSALACSLERRGYAVSTADNGENALRLILERRFDLALLDVMMPGIDGLEVLTRLRQKHSPTELPVIMVTAQDESVDIVRALELGANDYVTKPLDFPVALARIRTHLDLKTSVEQVLQLEARLSSRNQELESANAELLRNAEQRRTELETAARVQAAFLPSCAPRIGSVRFAWAFEPCNELAGDALNILSLDAEHVAFYVLDVSGHGVAASLLAVAATRILSVSGNADSILIDKSADGVPAAPARPADVAQRLNKTFAWDSATEKFLTLFYALYNSRTRDLTYVSAGHPGALLISGDSKPVLLDGGGLPIGIGEGYEQRCVRLEPGDRVYAYSDGITEAMNPARQLLGRDRLTSILRSGSRSPLEESVSQLLLSVKQWAGDLPPQDDLSLVAMECE